MSKKSIGTLTASLEDFSAELKLADWVYELEPIEQADLLLDVLYDAMEAYNTAVHLLHASFEAKTATKQ